MGYYCFGPPPSCIELASRMDMVKKRLVSIGGKMPSDEADSLMHEWARLTHKLEDAADLAEYDWGEE